MPKKQEREPTELVRRILETVARIPRGRVASYGQVAHEAGFPKRARAVGMALRGLPRGTKVPWHRVINAQGKSAFPPGSAPWKRQRDRLAAEAVPFLGGRVDLERYRWQPRDPSPLLD